jgi:hypothetical protein
MFQKNWEEMAEYKLEKHAMLEVLFLTQHWSDTYVKNPYIYVTDVDSDFEGERGIHLKDHFKKVFLLNYQKYMNIVSQVTPSDVIKNQIEL